jgi:protease IV
MPSPAALPKKSSLLWWLLGFGALLAVACVGLVVFASKAGSAVGRDGILRITIAGDIPEHARGDELTEIFGGRPVSILEHLENLQKAAKDDNVKGVLLVLQPSNLGWAKIEELRDGLVEFKKSKKFVYAYSEYLSEKEYALALAADEIIMPGDSPFEFDGISSEVSHYPGLLEKLGVEVQYFRFGKYKSVSGQSMGLKTLTEPVKEMINENLDVVYGHFVDAVAEFRKMPKSEVLSAINDSHFKSDWAKDKKLLDRLAYWDEVETLLREKTNTKGDDKLNFISPSKYRNVSPSSVGIDEGKDTIAVIYSQGLIVAGKGGSDGLSGGDSQGAEPLIENLRRAINDDNVKAVVFRVDSPGGAGLGCDFVRREVEKAKAKKPVIVSMSDVAASGGYWVSMHATAIVAQPTTATGSIGIYSVVPSLQKTYEKLGLNHEVFRRGDHADAMQGSRLFTDEEAKRFDDDLHASYVHFVELAAKGRGKSNDEMEKLAQGRTWMGSSAAENGLVDKIGGFPAAISLAKEKAGLPPDRAVKVAVFDRKRSLFEAFGQNDDDEEANVLTDALAASVLKASGFDRIARRFAQPAQVARLMLLERERLFPISEFDVQYR